MMTLGLMIMMVRKEELGKVFMEEKLPAWLKMMEGVLEAQVNPRTCHIPKTPLSSLQGGSYFSGTGLTWADIVMYDMLARWQVIGSFLGVS